MKRCDQSGFVSGSEGLLFGAGVLLITTLIFANVWSVFNARFVGGETARAMGRAYAEANDPMTALAGAYQRGAEVLQTHGQSGEDTKLAIDAQGYERCQPFTIAVSVPVRYSILPGIATHRTAFRVQSTYSDVIDPYRSGLEGEAHCE